MILKSVFNILADSCLATPAPCHTDADCTNIVGGTQTCVCKTGFVGTDPTANGICEGEIYQDKLILRCTFMVAYFKM